MKYNSIEMLAMFLLLKHSGAYIRSACSNVLLLCSCSCCICQTSKQYTMVRLMTCKQLLIVLLIDQQLYLPFLISIGKLSFFFTFLYINLLEHYVDEILMHVNTAITKFLSITSRRPMSLYTIGPLATVVVAL